MRKTNTITRWSEGRDIEHIARLLRGLLVYTASLYGKPESEIKSAADILNGLERTAEHAPNIRYVVAENDFGVTGICAIETSFSTWHAKPYIIINDVFVDPKHRKAGIGSALMQFVMDYAREIGCCRVDLFVESDNASAQRFYEHFGFDKLNQISYSIPIDPTNGLP